jgi:hypothetical protein
VDGGDGRERLEAQLQVVRPPHHVVHDAHLRTRGEQQCASGEASAFSTWSSMLKAASPPPALGCQTRTRLMYAIAPSPGRMLCCPGRGGCEQRLTW